MGNNVKLYIKIFLILGRMVVPNYLPLEANQINNEFQTP